MLATLHSLLVYQNLSSAYSDTYRWSVADLCLAVDQLQVIGCDLHAVDDVSQILAHVYASRCHSKRDAERIRAFICRLISAWATGSDVIAQFTLS